MRIESIETVMLRAELEQPFGWSQFWTNTRSTTLVRVRTDDGIEGLGECFGPPESAKAIIDGLYAPKLVGRDPLDTEVIWTDLYQLLRQHGQKGLSIQALSGVDIALWDIKGKALGLPVYKLMGGAYRDEAVAYATGMYFTEGSWVETRLAEEAAGYVGRGFGYVKMKVGMGVEADTVNVRAVREAVGPDIGLMADANYGYNVNDALRLGRELERQGLLWFEEPVPPEDLDGYCELRAALDIPIAGGEAEFTRYGARELIRRRAVDILQPDVCAGGGLTEGKRMADLAHLHNIPCMPHVWGTNIGLAASLHFAATIAPTPPSLYAEGPLFEHDSTPHPLRDALTVESFPAVDGVVRVPDGPGLGVTVNEEAVERFRAG